MTEERRRARWAKYLESDPARRWQVDYTYALVPPGVVRPWPRRPADLPVLRAGDVVAPWDLDMLDLEGPVLSVVVVVRLDDEVDAVELVRTLVDEDAGVPTEVLVADVAGMGTAELVAAEFPSVQVLALNRDFSPDQARDLALRTARGDYVLVLNPADGVARGTLEAVVKAHEAGHGLVTGTVENVSRSATGWAIYFLDHAASLGPQPGALAVAPTRASVPLEAAIALGTGRLDGPAQPSVCEELFADGFSAVHVDGLTLVHRHPGTSGRRFLRDRFRRGRALVRLTRRSSSGRTTSSLVGVRQRLHTIRAGVGKHPECRGPYRRVAPLVAAGLAATWVGAAWERLATLAPRWRHQ